MSNVSKIRDKCFNDQGESSSLLYNILISCHRTCVVACYSVVIGLEMEGYYKILPQKSFSSHIHSFIHLTNICWALGMYQARTLEM